MLLFKVNVINGFNPPPPFSKNGLKLACNVNIVWENLKSEISEVYAPKPQRNVYEFGVNTSPEAEVNNDPGEAEEEEELQPQVAGLRDPLRHLQHLQAETEDALHCKK